MTRKLICIFALLMMIVMVASPALADKNDGKLNLNKATAEQLAALPDIDDALAAAIVELREENGEFVDIMELLDVEGIDNSLLRKLERSIYIEPVSDCNC